MDLIRLEGCFAVCELLSNIFMANAFIYIYTHTSIFNIYSIKFENRTSLFSLVMKLLLKKYFFFCVETFPCIFKFY